MHERFVQQSFDADHIAAIDNTTRKLVAENGKHKVHTVGFWFALGHSSVVFILVALPAFEVRTLAANLENQDSRLQQWTGLWGTSISGTFLIVIGLLNLASLLGIWRVFRQMRQGGLRRGAARARAGQPGPVEPGARAGRAAGRETVADVSGRTVLFVATWVGGSSDMALRRSGTPLAR
ncbi:hypothetical protein OIE68_31075 [Nocardia vinacea]|nr:hypothetical protein OIE68_31075 [Nocardia vinacea]